MRNFATEPKIVIFFTMLMILLTLLSIGPEVEAKTESLQVKSTVDILNVRAKASTNSKIIGKLKKNQSVQYIDSVFDEKTWSHFYKIVYKGKTGYISRDYSEIKNPQNKWIAHQRNDTFNSGSGVALVLTIYKKTASHIYFLSEIGIRNSKMTKKGWTFKTYRYSGKAKITSTNTASFSAKGCKTTFKLKGKSVELSQQSKGESCKFTRFSSTYGEKVLYR